MKILSIILLISGAFVSTFAQTPQGTPQRPPSDADTLRRHQEETQKVDDAFDNLRNLDRQAAASYSPVFGPPPSPKLTREQAARVIPAPEDEARFEAFLKQPKTGLMKLFPDLECESKYVVSVQEACRDAIPISSFYSFRKTNYSIRELADISLKDNLFTSDGLLSNGIIAALGDIPIETVSINSDGLKFLSEYVPARETSEVTNISKELSSGIKDSGYSYALSSPVAENTTYVIRIIAYQGRVMKRRGPIFYNILEGDKRVDIIAVFRIVGKNRDGSLTLLWKELERKDSPKIKISKEDEEKYKIRSL